MKNFNLCQYFNLFNFIKKKSYINLFYLILKHKISTLTVPSLFFSGGELRIFLFSKIAKTQILNNFFYY